MYHYTQFIQCWEELRTFTHASQVICQLSYRPRPYKGISKEELAKTCILGAFRNQMEIKYLRLYFQLESNHLDSLVHSFIDQNLFAHNVRQELIRWKEKSLNQESINDDGAVEQMWKTTGTDSRHTRS